jgi:hypothetical protein
MIKRMAIAGAIGVLAVAALASSAGGVAKVGLEMIRPDPSNVNVMVGVIKGKDAKELKGASHKRPKFVLKKRPKGVVAIYGLQKVEGKKNRYRLIVFAFRGRAKSLSKAMNVQMNVSASITGKKVEEIDSVVGSNDPPTSPRFDMAQMNMQFLAGKLARNDIALNAFAQSAYHEAYNEPYDGRDKFLDQLGGCCKDK